MKRGDIVVLRQPGSFASKARPCLIVQTDFALPPKHYITVCPITSLLRGTDLFRIPIHPTADNGLRLASEIEIDLINSISVGGLGAIVGNVGASTMEKVDAALRRWLGL